MWQPQELALQGGRPEFADVPVDLSSWYLTDEEDMGESVEQGEIIRTLLSVLAAEQRIQAETEARRAAERQAEAEAEARMKAEELRTTEARLQEMEALIKKLRG